jgi:hypothetical protein
LLNTLFQELGPKELSFQQISETLRLVFTKAFPDVEICNISMDDLSKIIKEVNQLGHD